MFVDNQARVVYGQLYVWDYEKNEFINHFINDVMSSIRAVYQQEAMNVVRQAGGFPLARPTLGKIKNIIIFKVQENSSSAQRQLKP